MTPRRATAPKMPIKMSLPEYIVEIKDFLLDRGVTYQPEAAIILGSGLGRFSETITGKTSIHYTSIPHFPQVSVTGHSGELIFGRVKQKSVIAFSGRFHHYEGYDFELTALPVYISHLLNARKLIISNAAGSVNTGFRVGDLMAIESVLRLNHMTSPITSDPFRYNLQKYATKVRELANEAGLITRQGTYLFVKGPNYETKAEVRAFRFMGADAVGMSTVPELIEASRLNIKTAGISLITNMASGIIRRKLDHSEVKRTAGSRNDDFSKLISYLIEHL